MARVGYIGKCHFCTRTVYKIDGVAYGVVGWEGERSQGGANQIMMRQRVPEKVAHLACAKRAAERMKRGVALDQEALVFE